jgi:acyl carrier protein
MTTQEALDIIGGAIGGKNVILHAGMNRDEVPNWDSVGNIMLMAELDEKCGIVLEERDLNSLNSIDDILAVMRRNGRLDH